MISGAPAAAWAQETAGVKGSLKRPWRLSLGVSTSQRVEETGSSGSSFFGLGGGGTSTAPYISFGLARDLTLLGHPQSDRADSRAVVSVFYDAATHASLLGSGSGYTGFGVSLRSAGPKLYGGAGLGFYNVTGSENSGSGLGGKLFAGTPLTRALFAEINLTLPGAGTNAIPSLQLGFRF